jgi:hypothetical protein
VSEPDFESQLAKLYREVPPQPDDEAFLSGVESRLDAHVRSRRRLLTGLGLLGGFVTLAALAQFEATATLQQFVTEALDAATAVLSMAWGSAAALALIALLALPAFMRAVIDPK